MDGWLQNIFDRDVRAMRAGLAGQQTSGINNRSSTTSSSTPSWRSASSSAPSSAAGSAASASRYTPVYERSIPLPTRPVARNSEPSNWQQIERGLSLNSATSSSNLPFDKSFRKERKPERAEPFMQRMVVDDYGRGVDLNFRTREEKQKKMVTVHKIEKKKMKHKEKQRNKDADVIKIEKAQNYNKQARRTNRELMENQDEEKTADLKNKMEYKTYMVNKLWENVTDYWKVRPNPDWRKVGENHYEPIRHSKKCNCEKCLREKK
jgi:hypothetical protein